MESIFCNLLFAKKKTGRLDFFRTTMQYLTVESEKFKVYVMNVYVTGMYDNTVIVENNLFEGVRLLQTGLSSSSDGSFHVVESLPFPYANLSTFTTLYNDNASYK
jgi:hypothetical protein